jgi:hypothetical protein
LPRNHAGFAGLFEDAKTPPETAQNRLIWVGTAAELQRRGQKLTCTCDCLIRGSERCRQKRRRRRLVLPSKKQRVWRARALLLVVPGERRPTRALPHRPVRASAWRARADALPPRLYEGGWFVNTVCGWWSGSFLRLGVWSGAHLSIASSWED